MPLQPHEERVIAEKRELDEKIAKLDTFIYGKRNTVFQSLEQIDQSLLEEQFNVMRLYSELLRDRIARFKQKEGATHA